MGEEVLGGRVGRLVIQQSIAGLAFHVRLAGEQKDFDRLGICGGVGSSQRDEE